jgi:2Fe-2S ferredoxin
MGSLKLTMTDVNGVVHQIADATEGLSLMEVAKAKDVVGIMADCGGACSCATCHVFVDLAWVDRVGQPDDVEFAMLDMVSDVAQENSRLSCQIKLTAALDGLTVTVAPAAGW